MDDLLDFSSDTYFMGEALRQARKAESQDEVPIGAVIVRHGEIIARAWNQVEILKDATAHAEMLAITQAERSWTTGDWRTAISMSPRSPARCAQEQWSKPGFGA